MQPLLAQKTIRVLQQALDLLEKTCDSRTIDHSMVGRESHWHQVTDNWLTIDWNELFARRCYRQNRGLRRGDDRHKNTPLPHTPVRNPGRAPPPNKQGQVVFPPFPPHSLFLPRPLTSTPPHCIPAY